MSHIYEIGALAALSCSCHAAIDFNEMIEYKKFLIFFENSNMMDSLLEFFNPAIPCFKTNCFDPPLSPYEQALEKRQQFHKRILCTYNTLPKNSKLKEIAKRFATIVAIPFVYLVLTWKIRNAMALAPPSKDANLNKELVRLKDVLTVEDEAQIDVTISQLSENLFRRKVRNADYASPEQEREMKIIISQALEIKKTHEQDCFIVTHGSNSQWYVVSQLIKILVQKYNPQNSAPPQFEFLRSTQRTPAKDINGYQNANGSNDHPDHDREVRSSLLASDVCWSTTPDESALDYFVKNRSILSEDSNSEIRKTCETILSEYLPKETDIQKIKDCAVQLQSLAREINTICGQLFVICIPKANYKNLHEVGFLSHPYGKPCYCHKDNPEVLEQLQKGNAVSCFQGGDIPRYAPPQFRLMTDKITPPLGAQSYLLNTLTTKQKMDIYTKVSEAVAQIFHSQRGKA